MDGEQAPFPLRHGRRAAGATDAREQFQSGGNAAGVEAERAFLQARIELLQRDPLVTADERERGLAELRARLAEISDKAPGNGG